MNSSAGLRAQLRTGVAALWGALTATAAFVGPDIPDPIVAAWGLVYFAAFGIGEAVYDSRRKRTTT